MEPISKGKKIERNEDGTFKKGTIANPTGRPKGSRQISTLVREALLEMAKTKDGKEVNLEKALVKTIIEKAVIQKDNYMIKLIWNYLDGMPSQNINVTNVDDLRDEYFSKLDNLIGKGDCESDVQERKGGTD